VAALRDTDDPGQRRQYGQELGERLKEHIRWEESVLFEETQTKLSPEAMAALGEEIAERIPEFLSAPIWPVR
jgi:hypothetical protein